MSSKRIAKVKPTTLPSLTFTYIIKTNIPQPLGIRRPQPIAPRKLHPHPAPLRNPLHMAPNPPRPRRLNLPPRPLRPRPHPASRLPLQAANAQVRHPHLPPQHNQRLARQHLPGPAEA